MGSESFFLYSNLEMIIFVVHSFIHSLIVLFKKLSKSFCARSHCIRHFRVTFGSWLYLPVSSDYVILFIMAHGLWWSLFFFLFFFSLRQQPKFDIFLKFKAQTKLESHILCTSFDLVFFKRSKKEGTHICL